MPELRDLLAAEARRQEATSVPPFDQLVVRARRRRRLQVGGSVTAVVLVVAAAVISPSVLRSGHAKTAPTVAPTPSAAALPVSPGVYALLRRTALQMAQGDGDQHPTRMEAVAVTDVDAADDALSRDVVHGTSGPGYAVEVEGIFACRSCSSLAGASPKGHDAYVILRAGSFEAEGGGLSNQWADLTTLGQAFSLTPPATAAPETPLVVSESPAPGLSVAASAGPAAPDPKTLAEAEGRAKESTTDPTRATIVAATAAPAGRLRIAGLSIPAGVTDATTMFVVVVSGESIFPSGLGADGKQPSEFAVVFNTDGTSRGDQAVFHGALGLPAMAGTPAPVATVVAADELSRSGLQWVAAPPSARSSAVPVAEAVTTAGVPAGAKPLAALVYADTVHVHHRLAWVVETYGSVSGASTPEAQPAGAIDAHIETDQVVVDATTGKRLVSTSF